MGDFISGFRNSREIGSVRNVCMKSMPAGTHTVEEEKKKRKKKSNKNGQNKEKREKVTNE